jgi:4-amino-4-deoxy-L-arabinose transferase-like glycosyltransferase
VADPASASPAPVAGPDPPAPAERRRERRLLRAGLAGALLCFVTLAGWCALRMPVYGPADEASHVGYAREVGHGRLPTIKTVIPAAGDQRMVQLVRRRDAAHRTIWVANHPPLFYALTAVPVRVGSAIGHPVRGVVGARMLSVGLSALGLLAIAFVVLQLVPGRPQLAVAAAGFAALLPSLAITSAVVHNDSLAFLTTTATAAAAVVFVIRGPSALRLAAVAAAASLAALTRLSGIAAVGIACLAVFVGVWLATDRGVLRRLVRAGLWSAAVAAAVVAASGWFWLRNLTMYGDLSGADALCDHFTYCRNPPGTFLDALQKPSFWLNEQLRLWDTTFWMKNFHGSLTRRLWLLGLVPLAGLLLAGGRALVRRARGGPRPDRGRLAATALCVLLLGVVQVLVAVHVAAGGTLHVRYLFPALVTIGLGAAVGLAALPGGRRGLPTVAMLVVMSAVAPVVLWRYLAARDGLPGTGQLTLMVPLLALGVGLQAYALWHLRPADAGPAPDAVRAPARVGGSSA